MVDQYFNIRRSGGFEKGHSAFDLKTSNEEHPYLRLCYRLGRNPEDFVPAYLDGEGDPKAIKAFNELLSKHGITVIDETTMSLISQAALDDLFEAVLTEEFIDEIGQDVISKIQVSQEGDQIIDHVRIVVPFPVNPEKTKNPLAPSFAAAVTHALEDRLPDLLEEAGLQPHIQVMAELDSRKISPEDAIVNLSKNSRSNIDIRGSSENQTEPELLEYAANLAQQPVYFGPVHSNAVYVPVDDNLFGQTTLASLVDYIRSNNAQCTATVTISRWVTGIEELGLKQETLDLLNQAFEDLPDKEEAKKKLQDLYAKVGLTLDFDVLENNTFSNMEVLFLATVFANGENPTHAALYETALHSIGSNSEIFSGTIPDYAMKAPPPDIQKMKSAFVAKLQGRSMLISEQDERFTTLQQRDTVTAYELEM